jgi:hypothetical protein
MLSAQNSNVHLLHLIVAAGVSCSANWTLRVSNPSVLFLPKFHCGLNFIEQCWGYAKQIYRFFPESSREEDLECNVRKALALVPLKMMRRFGNRSKKFVDAYHKGLNGRQAAWAARKYKGHRIIPESILRELEEAGII